jgi:hypothetical protein
MEGSFNSLDKDHHGAFRDREGLDVFIRRMQALIDGDIDVDRSVGS